MTFLFVGGWIWSTSSRRQEKQLFPLVCDARRGSVAPRGSGRYLQALSSAGSASLLAMRLTAMLSKPSTPALGGGAR